jgi:Domain of unknown function (DUF4260)
LLRVEGAVVLLLMLFGHWMTQGNWWVFALLLLAPDLSMIGYLGGTRTGAAVYNMFHTYLLPAVLLAAGISIANSWMTHIAMIWFAHIGMDRLLGYGLKYPTAFKDTHFQRL